MSKTRLRELVALAGDDKLTARGIDPSAWIAHFKRVRKTLAHTGAHVPARADANEDLDIVNGQTRAVLTLLLLEHMGLESNAMVSSAQTLGSYPHRLVSDG